MNINFFHLILALVFATTIDYRLLAGMPGVPSITFTEIFAYGALFLYLGRAAFEETEIIHEVSTVYASGRIVFLYFAWGAVSAVAGLVVRGQAEVLEAYRSLLPGLAMYILVLLFVDSIARAHQVLAAFLAGMYLNVALAFMQILTGGPRPVAVNEAFTQKLDYDGKFIDNAPTGLFNHPNGLALLLLPAAILLVALLARKNLPLRNYLLTFVSLAAIWFVLIMTYAKGAVAWAAIGTLLVLFSTRLSRLRFPMAVLATVGGIAAMTAYSILKVADGPSSLATMLTRVFLWWAAWDIIRSDLFVQVFGNGIAAMSSASLRFANLEYANSHNGIINQALFYGLPALAIYLAIFTGSLKKMTQVLALSDTEWRPVALFVLSALPALFGEYFFEPVSLNMTLQVHLFLIIAIGETAFRMSTRTSVEGGET